MIRRSPFATGFRALRREPSVLLAEIGWRWLFGGIASALVAWGVVLFLRSVEVSRGDQLLLRSLNPTIIVYVLRDLLANKWWLLGRLGLILSVSLSFMWVLTATIARTATTRVLLDFSAEQYGVERQTSARLTTVGAIQFFRIGLLWLGFFAYVLSAALAAWLTEADGESHTGAFLLVFFSVFLVVATVLALGNWVLLLAPILAIRDSLSFFAATAASWRLSRERAASFVGLNLAHLGLRLIWIVFISGVALIPFGFAQLFPTTLIASSVIAITLVYCAVSDALFVARYAGYITIAEQRLHSEPGAVQPSERVQSLPEPLPDPVQPDEPMRPPEL